MKSNFPFYNKVLVFIIVLICCLQYSCKKYLDAKSNQSYVIPSTLADLQALIDNSGQINLGQYPGLLELATDDYYVSYTDWSARTAFEKEVYIWADYPTYALANVNQNWSNSYKPVFYANAVLDELPNVRNDNPLAANSIKGSALFLRAFSFFNLAQIYCKPYEISEVNAPGIPLRLSSDFNIPSKRGTIGDTYNQIIADFKYASSLLPLTQAFPTRPTKIAAYAALARTYLAMEDYSNAGLYADSCLQLYNTLIDYNTLIASAARPFSVFNAETIFYSYSNGESILNPTRASIDVELYKSYDVNDLRKTVFFQDKGNDQYGFKGAYSGVLSGTFFNGLATDEIFLIRAECFARAGKTAEAIRDLNVLLKTRWNTKGTSSYQTIAANNAEQALTIILKERRKELVMRGLRWSDLRRLNRDPRFAKTLVRTIVNGNVINTYSLLPNDLKYVMLIPPDIIQITGMEQNPRK